MTTGVLKIRTATGWIEIPSTGPQGQTGPQGPGFGSYRTETKLWYTSPHVTEVQYLNTYERELSANKLYALPFIVGEDIPPVPYRTIDRLAVWAYNWFYKQKHTPKNRHVRFGVYLDSGSICPGNLLYEGDQVLLGNKQNGIRAIETSINVVPGIYWLAVCLSGLDTGQGELIGIGWSSSLVGGLSPLGFPLEKINRNDPHFSFAYTCYSVDFNYYNTGTHTMAPLPDPFGIESELFPKTINSPLVFVRFSV